MFISLLQGKALNTRKNGCNVPNCFQKTEVRLLFSTFFIGLYISKIKTLFKQYPEERYRKHLYKKTGTPFVRTPWRKKASKNK
jgi:hypothetical protein